jgi:hypothetical protein
MTEEFEKHGHWWLPNNDNNPIRGILRFEPTEGIILELEGILDFNEQQWKDDFEFVVGITLDNQYFTLIECLKFGTKSSSSLQKWHLKGIIYILKINFFFQKQ